MLIEVSEASQTGEARRKATAFAEELQMSETQCGEVALVTTEMATNLVKHAGRGHILFRPLKASGREGLQITSVDKGPGIRDISHALSDGPLAEGSLGSGLGTIRRVPDSFDLYSVPGSGTVISAEFWLPGTQNKVPMPLEVGIVSEPIRGEEFCGDGWVVRHSEDGALLMVVDGLGHGPLASEAAREAEQVFSSTKAPSLVGILTDIHDALRKTRGAAVAIAKIDVQKGLLTFAGIGNIGGAIVTQDSGRNMTSHNGTLGQRMERAQEFTYPWNSDSILVMYSDGLVSRWDLERYPGIWNKPASVTAALLHRDFNRGRDDVTVLVAKAARPQ
ncbi:MAG TPA: ATP-binding SpoIIE family protein phosphatase [Candidatus Acidoferrales bacterium]